MAVELRWALDAASADLLAYFERRAASLEDAADLLAETMLQAWRRVAELPTDAERQRMWLFGTARYVLANHHRAGRRQRALSEKLRAHLAQVHVADDAEASAVRGAVRDAVRRLPHDQRELVMLVHWDGFSLVAAAELLGVNPSTVRGRYAAARQALRESLAEAGSGPPAAVDQLAELSTLPAAR
jgi:RNA polymerase sigma-70 factor (ECF subfamily)